ncbi:MAG TPA: tryptophan tryptophylquinone biosynthesis enzyme MauG, partial [Bradyrhizobium sp.]|nr:tryptophan tryptophylquinone biosynthesis enzyme MauG [Bradyrhizobium sp.]
MAAATLGVIGFANVSFGEAIVGEMRRTEPAPKAAAAINAMKAEYRRPALIPFPKENPYTPEKAALGKKLYFDTR